MELRVNIVLLLLLAGAWAQLTATTPTVAFAATDPGTVELARMEDRFARDRTDVALARRLAEAYLDLERPGLAVAALRSGDPAILEHPVVAHRLAQAYEQSGRVRDALATADLALARCARSLGTSDAPSGTALPRFACSGHEHAVLRVHREALGYMARWGVSRPQADPRARVAYDIASRSARIALSD